MDIKKKKPLVDITVVDNNSVKELHIEILELILDSNIDSYTILGLLECIRQEVLDSIQFTEAEEDDNEEDI